jgi:putative phage-type endonuclease
VSGAAILPDKRTRWLAERRSLITASDVPAILGEDPRRGALAVWCEKTGEVEPKDTLPMRRGRRFEAAIGEEYSDQTGRIVLSVPEYELLRHPDVKWVACSLDRKTVGSVEFPDPLGGRNLPAPPGAVSEPAPLEIKMSLGSASAWKDEAPLGYQIQVQIQLACADSRWGALAGMVGPGPLKVHDLVRNDAFLDAALPRLEEFHWRVKNREPPEADGLPGTTAAIRALWADEDGETIPLDRGAMELVEAWDQAKVRRDAADGTVAEIENALRVRMGSASFGALTDGSFLTLKKTRRRGYVVEPTEYRALRRFRPRIRRR